MNASRVREPVVLPEDVAILPVEELTVDLRDRVGPGTGDFAVIRPRARAGSMLVGADAARLLERFREPTTIVDAVIAASEELAATAEAVLEDAYPLLRTALDGQLLLPADSENAQALRPSFAPGDELAGARIETCVHLLEDVEVYRATAANGAARALKIARAGAGPQTAAALRREAAALAVLAGAPAPELVDEGEHDNGPYLVLEWCPGTTAWRWSAGTRDRGDELLRGVCAIADAYAALHARGVVHGDVHPRNVLVDGTRVRLIDFGFARILGGAGAEPPRAGAGFAHEPEYALAQLAGTAPPPATFAGDEHALAALLYLLLTGQQYLPFSWESARVFEQIARDVPQPFLTVGRAPHRPLERVLGRALSKRPEDRFPSCVEFADALREAAAGPAPARAAAPARSLPGEDALRERFGFGSVALRDGLPRAPTASVNHGAAGIAYVFLRLAELREDGGLLALADAWAARAVAERERPDAFGSVALGLLPAETGPISLYHTVSGVHCVRALVSATLGDDATAAAAVRAFAGAVTGATWDGTDLTLGWGSVLLGCALLREGTGVETSTIDRVAAAALARVWSEPVGPPRYDGIAHGSAGLLYAALRWWAASGQPLPGDFPERLDSLADRRRADGAWALGPALPAVWPGWCHGSAGHALLWVLAHRATGAAEHLAHAEGAAEHSWRHAAERTCTLCCGLAGQAYTMLALHRATGERRWLDRARTLATAARAVADRDPDAHASLYRGGLGVDLLEAELACPERARMPLFEPLD